MNTKQVQLMFDGVYFTLTNIYNFHLSNTIKIENLNCLYLNSQIKITVLV